MNLKLKVRDFCKQERLSLSLQNTGHSSTFLSKLTWLRPHNHWETQCRLQRPFEIVGEYSHFPFALACKDVGAHSVIGCLCQLFSVYGMPAYNHSDRGSSFMSEELRHFLLSKGIATSCTTPYNPACNGPVERYNGAVWKAIIMALRTRGLPVTHWQDVLPDALHSLRSLLWEVFQIWETIIHWQIYANLAIDTRPCSSQMPCSY